MLATHAVIASFIAAVSGTKRADAPRRGPHNARNYPAQVVVTKMIAAVYCAPLSSV